MKRLLLVICMLALLVPVTATARAASDGIWLSPQEIAALPTTGAAWTALVAAAKRDPGVPAISNQDSDNDVLVLAKALVYARTGDAKYRTEVIANLKAAINTEDGGRTLALARNLVGYVISADLINLAQADPSFEVTFKLWLKNVRTETLSGKTLISTHEDRPNNWGTHAGASRVAVAMYLGDTVDLAKAAKVFEGWAGNRSAYSAFAYGDLVWQCLASAPVGVNPKGCIKNEINIAGAQPEEMRRGGPLQASPSYTGYPWEALQGAVVQALLLERAGYPALAYGDQAILRAAEYLYKISWPAEGDDLWQPYLLNYAYSVVMPTKLAGHGKNMGWTDWTHGGRRLGAEPNIPTVTPTATVPASVTATTTASPPVTATPTSAAPTVVTPTVIAPTVTTEVPVLTFCLRIVMTNPPSSVVIPCE